MPWVGVAGMSVSPARWTSSRRSTWPTSSASAPTGALLEPDLAVLVAGDGQLGDLRRVRAEVALGVELAGFGPAAWASAGISTSGQFAQDPPEISV
jgi:hypothetical protein